MMFGASTPRQELKEQLSAIMLLSFGEIDDATDPSVFRHPITRPEPGIRHGTPVRLCSVTGHRLPADYLSSVA